MKAAIAGGDFWAFFPRIFLFVKRVIFFLLSTHRRRLLRRKWSLKFLKILRTWSWTTGFGCPAWAESIWIKEFPRETGCCTSPSRGVSSGGGSAWRRFLALLPRAQIKHILQSYGRAFFKFFFSLICLFWENGLESPRLAPVFWTLVLLLCVYPDGFKFWYKCSTWTFKSPA